LWRETAVNVAKEFKEITMDFMFVDNAAMQLIQWPGRFDVIVTENMFGDILSDEASVLTGSLGLLPSASVGLLTSVFEPIHGSYPQAAGKNIANPLGTILSAAMMFDLALNLKKEAEIIKEAVEKSIEADYVTEDLNRTNPKSTSQVGNWISNYILKR
jgi:3-isopropylmalate dehydrogenase